jgi:ribonuclease Z
MDRIIILGTAHSVAYPDHENTHLAILAGGRSILVDCPGSPVSRLQKAGINPLSLTDIVLTHFHPDHVSGLPLLLMDLWLLGRSEPLDVYGLPSTLDLAVQNMNLYNWENWSGFFPVRFHRFCGRGKTVLFETEKIRLSAAEVCHLIPTIGLRIDQLQTGKSAAYSCDTEPCPAVIDLAESVDFLLHEATGLAKGHTSARQAGEVAAQAGGKSLYLIHYPSGENQETMLEDAKLSFGRLVVLANDFMEIPLE